jgi:hypothetical protein
MKVFVVYYMADSYGGGGYPIKVFDNEQKAKAFLETKKRKIFATEHFTNDYDYEDFVVE